MQKSILVVEDQQSIREVVQMVLELEGYQVRTSPNGECFQHMEHEQPDLIVLDVLLSAEDGVDLCKQLKNNVKTRGIPIILLSALPNLREAADLCGADYILAKPFRVHQLREVVKQYLV